MRTDAAGLVAGLLQQLTPGGLVGRLAGVDRAGRDLEQRPVDRVPTVADEADMVGVHHRDQGDGPAMQDDLALGGRPVPQRH